jgi:AraC family transcriptional regulator
MPELSLSLHNGLAAQLSPSPTATSFGRTGWSGIVVNWHDWQSGGRVTSPELDHDVIAMRTSGIVRLTQIREGKTHTAVVTGGNVTVHPRGMESSWNWDRPGAILLMRIPSSLLLDAAEATVTAPPVRTELQNCFGRRDSFVERIGMLFLEELRSPCHPAQEYITQALSHALAAHLVQRFGCETLLPQRLPAGLHPRALQRVQDYIQSHLHEHVDLDTLAAVANVSRFHFARLFRKSAGMSAMAYLEQSRMERAQELIRRGEQSLARVAWQVGYGDQSYFTRRFRRFYGVTPSAYGREMGVIRRAGASS